ncbi:MAG: type III polyketide synthase [Phycisphaeraceae bacterium]|nr:type III polyketide synthase [Phycisphaeraceae bacterium]
MSVFVHQIACQVPQYPYDQDTLRQKMLQWLAPDRRTARIINRIYKESGIQTRYSVLPDTGITLGLSDGPCEKTAGTGHRNALYTESARRLYVDVSRQVLAECRDIGPEQITHLITVSCTGFFNPGPDYEIIRQVPLNPTVQRFHIGFMGCYGAFPAMRLAQSICQADPGACVLIVDVELCSLHLQIQSDLNSILGGALFADGAAALLVNSQSPNPAKPALELNHFSTTLLPNSETDMAWTIGDHGFEMILSPQVPRLIEANLLDVLHPSLQQWGHSVSDIHHWAVHPGGKAILDRIEALLMLEDQLTISRSVLRDYGNMSSVTILFVLQMLLNQTAQSTQEPILAMAFGPGLTMEMGLLHKVSSAPLKVSTHSKAQRTSESCVSTGDKLQ